jgi:hypothetical protein
VVGALAFAGVASHVVVAAPAQAGSCVYYVEVYAYVRENPDGQSVIRKSKGAYERVTGPCRTVSTDYGWTAVYCSCASDGIGWMLSNKLDGPYYT